ncbi:DUF4232 domain-containing protein [Streptomyces sp. NPDC051452]|uniref:DUF4232 domain-containing protein n=1 Tax=Streptomyces sp. NPDC051452 TaxID=3365654 RepID=UPI00379C8304
MNGAARGAAAAVATVTAAALVLTGCGDRRSGERADGSRPNAGPRPVSADPPCPSAPSRHAADPADGPSRAGTAPKPSGTPLPLPAGTAAAQDGVRIADLSGRTSGTGEDCALGGLSAGLTVTNHTGTAMTYTVTLALVSADGGAVDTLERTVTAVPPGRTVRNTADLGSPPARGPAVTSVAIEKVRSVPADEAPSTSGTCPASGIHLAADRGDAAMGLRAVSLHLENCGTRAYTLGGRPTLRVLGTDHEPVTGVRVVHGEEVATGTGADGSPRPLTLRPGERAYAVLTWRDTTTDGTPVNAPYVRVWAKPGAPPVTVTPELDLGTTGRLGVGPWKKEDTGR